MALTLRDTSMFSGLRCRDLPLNESVGSLCDYAKTSDSLEHLCLSGVLPDAARLSGTGARSSIRLLVEALAAGAAARLPLTELDLSHNELRDGGVLAVRHTGLELRTSRALTGLLLTRSGLALVRSPRSWPRCRTASKHSTSRAATAARVAAPPSPPRSGSTPSSRPPSPPSAWAHPTSGRAPQPNFNPNPTPNPNPNPNRNPNPNPLRLPSRSGSSCAVIWFAYCGLFVA